ncbi:hypothetical protein SERLADRAFT_464728 [Serpula lacrymans var. lacrymans S7.9]|uniref:Uncharacterized protein n=1 Tax=Serpula lacrymans var. lacrymans (strain S7.9) TaxID=578457 RepID=F8NQ62_SERL9|nr:uncharacterized protein SERLADRAFT_464728 [Serpula lacrymans var. lacrymans S7.9]EGO27014.1 hypothetical protein SERLADRAFT_464728 [Serpula lacrymans var. lacrymans S7.9]
MLYTIFHHITASKSARTVEDQHWGLEWKYLPVGPVTASGGLQDNWEIEVPLQHEAMKNLVSTHQEFSRNITAERMQIQQHGHLLHIKRVIDSDTLSKLLAALKQAGSSVSFLLDTAQVLAIFKQESVQATLMQDTNVLLDFSIISLDKFYVPPFNS